MSADDNAQHPERKRKVNIVQNEYWGDDVSIIMRNDKSSVGTVILKIFFGLFFIGLATGAIVYAVNNSEEEQNQPTDKNASLYFPYDISQQCTNGTLTLVYRLESHSEERQYTLISHGAQWVQDATRKRLYHRVGLTEADWQYSYFVLSNITFFLTKVGCSKIQQTYEDFLEGFSFPCLREHRHEQILLNGHYTQVVVYEGEPEENLTVGGEHPTLIRGYSSEQRGAVYGWEMYFPQSSSYSLYKKIYWYPRMTSLDPFWDIFNEIPFSCLHS